MKLATRPHTHTYIHTHIHTHTYIHTHATFCCMDMIIPSAMYVKPPWEHRLGTNLSGAFTQVCTHACERYTI